MCKLHVDVCILQMMILSFRAFHFNCWQVKESSNVYESNSISQSSVKKSASLINLEQENWSTDYLQMHRKWATLLRGMFLTASGQSCRSSVVLEWWWLSFVLGLPVLTNYHTSLYTSYQADSVPVNFSMQLALLKENLVEELTEMKSIIKFVELTKILVANCVKNSNNIPNHCHHCFFPFVSSSLPQSN